MVNKRVKKKVPYALILFVLAVITLIGSWLDAFPKSAVENIYFRVIFPRISAVFGAVSDALPVSLLDVWILLSLTFLIYILVRRRWRLLLGAVSFFYLWFFWGWGLNYHRPPVG